MSTWTRSAWGADDYDMWQAQLAAVGAALAAPRASSTASSPDWTQELGTGAGTAALQRRCNVALPSV